MNEENLSEQEKQDALDKFKKQHPGVWDLVLELFGDRLTDSEDGDGS